MSAPARIFNNQPKESRLEYQIKKRPSEMAGVTHSAITGSFGYYSFSEVEAGSTYVFFVSSKRYTFDPRVIYVTEDIEDLNFTLK